MNTPHLVSAPEVEAWLVAYVAKMLDVPQGEIGLDEEFAALGISSAEAVILTGDIQTWLGIILDPTLAWEHPTIRASAAEIARQAVAARSRTAREGPAQPFKSI